MDQVITTSLETIAAPSVIADAPEPAPRWTLKRLVQWVKEQFGQSLSRETLRKALHRLGLSWKKAKKLLNRADPAKREAYLNELHTLLNDVLHQSSPLVVYIDEAHINQDVDLGYGWAPLGERLFVGSHSPKLADKVSFYGAYIYNTAEVHVWPYECANTEHSQEVLEQLRQHYPDKPMTVIWDGASYHRTKTLLATAQELDITVMPLPGYSPDFMPVEALWRWLREEVTYHHCHTSVQELIERVQRFISQINGYPLQVADRLWVQSHLDPKEEELRIPR